MSIWKSIPSHIRENGRFIVVCIWSAVVLFLIMKSETMYTDAIFCVGTVFVAAKSYKKRGCIKEKQAKLNELSEYLEKIRYEISDEKNCVYWRDVTESVAGNHYYRVLCTLRDVYDTLGYRDLGTFADMLGTLQETVVKEHDSIQNTHRELSGLKWIVLLAIPTLSAIRVWVVANIGDMEIFYKSTGGILLKYGIWLFSLLVIMLFDRLEEIKSENYT